ncbi:cytochrome P450 [Mycena crocata]|nr:cytochrome P450 [Mycena crocata]
MHPVAVALALCLLASPVIRALLRCIFSPLDNVPGPPRKSLLTEGNLTQYHDPDGWEFHRDLEGNWGQVIKLHGLMGGRQLYVFDPTASNTLTSSSLGKGYSLLLVKIIANTEKHWCPRSQQRIFGDYLVPLFAEVAERAREGLIAPTVLRGPDMLDFNTLFGRLSLELTGRAGIGHSFDSLILGEAPTNRYAESLKELYDTAYKLSVVLPLLPLILKFPYRSFLRSMIPLIPSPTIRKLRDLVDYIDETAVKIVQDKKAAMARGELEVKKGSKDLMSILLKSNMSVEGKMHFTDEELVATVSMIIFAATDTTSTMLNRTLFTLATHPDVQETLRAEILKTQKDLDYDTLMALPYLDGVVREIFQLYPSISPGTFRYAKEDTVLPLRTSINHNKHIWGRDALEFRPERWSNGKAESVTTKMCGVYGNTMTFTGGRMSCIGFKFSQLETKVVVCTLQRAFRFSQPDPRIKWRMTGLMVTPNIDDHPKLPIRVERLDA